MTPDTVPQRRSPEELESEAQILEDHGDDLCAKKSRELAEELRKQQEGREKW